MASNNTLESRNADKRDSLLKFYERGHKYEIKTDKKSKYTSVTTWNHGHFPRFNADEVIENIFKSKSWGPDNKYWGKSADQIKASWRATGDAASGAGTKLHSRIENFMNNDEIQSIYSQKEMYELYNRELKDDAVEWEYFLDFVRDHPELVPYRTEWMIFDEELKIAGSIDMVYENPDGTLSIYDWKRCKEITKVHDWNKVATNPLIAHIPDTNFWHYALQLNTYKEILERQYGKKVTKLCLVRLHPDMEDKTYELLEVPILTKEMNDLFEERKIYVT